MGVAMLRASNPPTSRKLAAIFIFLIFVLCGRVWPGPLPTLMLGVGHDEFCEHFAQVIENRQFKILEEWRLLYRPFAYN
jgi:hypothetical protein